MYLKFHRSIHLLLAAVFFLAAAPTGAASPAASQPSIKLSGVLPAFADVLSFKISPDGRHAAFIGDLQADNAFELYSVPLSGGDPVRISGNLSAGSIITAYEFTPDSSRVIYRAPQDIAGIIELYSVPVTGPAAAGVKLNIPLVPGGHVLSFMISPDSSRVVFTADYATLNKYELFSVPAAGPAGEAVKLNLDLPPGGILGNYLISPDSSRVVYSADQDVQGRRELYSVPIGGPAADGVKLNPPPGTGASVSLIRLSPDSSRVVYLADHAVNSVFELYSTPIGGPAADTVKLNPPLVAGGGLIWALISPDSSRVVYLADQEVNDRPEIYSTPILGPAADGVKLNELPVMGGGVLNFHISPDNSRVVYQGDLAVDNVFEVFSVPLTGPAVAGIRLNPPLGADRDVLAFEVSPDGSRVLYYSDQEVNDVQEVYSVPLAGPATESVKLNRPLVPGGAVYQLRISPDSRYVVYHADLQVDNLYEIFHSPLTGWDAPPPDDGKVNSPFVPGGAIAGTNDFHITPHSGRVVYRADQDTDDMFELYVADLGEATLGFTETTAVVSETLGSFTFTVLLSADRIAPVEVAYAVTGGSATPGEDFSLPPGTLTFQPGDLMQSFSLNLLDDALIEDDETVIVTLSSPSGAGLSAATTFTLTITSNDILPPPPALYLTHLPLMQR